MHIVGIEANPQRTNVSFHTYECDCGETIVVEVGSV
jgi:hypothetical protein